MGQLNFFDISENYKALSKYGDSLEKLNKNIEREMFREPIEKAFKKERKSNAGRPHFDYIMMFKVLILQNLYDYRIFRWNFRFGIVLHSGDFWDWILKTQYPTKKDMAVQGEIDTEKHNK